MKKVIISLLILITSYRVYCDNHELLIQNLSSNSKKIRVWVYPISTIINGLNQYDFVAKTRYENTYNHSSYYTDAIEYIGDSKMNHWDLLPNQFIYFDVDYFNYEHPGESDTTEESIGFAGIIGYGNYKVIISTIDDEENPPYSNYIDSVIIQTDLSNYNGDHAIYFRDNGSPLDPRLMFKYDTEEEFRITSSNYIIIPWVHFNNRPRQYGFPYGSVYNIKFGGVNGIKLFPQDSRRDCNRELPNSPPFYFNSSHQNQNQEENGDWRTGTLINNMTFIYPYVWTPVEDERKDFPTVITVLKDGSSGPTLVIDESTYFYLVPDPEYSTTNNRYTVLNNYNIIELKWIGSALWVGNHNRFNMYSGSNLMLNHYSSTMYVESGGIFCNYGGTISGPGRIYIEGRNRCNNSAQDFIIKDSTKIIVEDSASWELEPNSTVTLEGDSTALIMKPYSEIKFGTNSKLILKNGARISANNCKFTSLDSNGTWDGIYLEDLSRDTLKYCTIENAVNGINIKDKVISGMQDPPPATEISNCTFKSSTSSTLLNYVYVNNSSNVLIKNCNAVKTSSGSFTSGIIAEYCPTNGVVVIDNIINYVATGISLIQSSEYIARNTITGSTNSGTGIYLDNSNGTIEYNIVNNFQKSISAYYSSPYLLKNTLSGASTKGVDLTSSSLPVMKPIASSGTLRWLGGNNTVTGTPSHSGICFVDCYPLMDSGYNRVIVNGADYMNGTFTQVNTTVYARINYWYDSPPQSSLFDITNGSVNYSNPFDGSTLPSTDGSELNSIGWGLYDTVFTKDLGDSPTAEDLFMQAYTTEMQSEYEDAIDLYKEVVSTYKTSSYAPVSLSRIFNCLEKDNNTTISDYQSIQSYYNSIKNSSAHPMESRELAEDFVIKSKVKRGLLENAIDDYDNIYQQNTNNSKGHHALINKLCLENMLLGGDNPNGQNSIESHKLAILSLITGEEIKSVNFANNTTPVQFKLHQNYPNPFNPITTIKYDIPKDNFVSIKIYDILGREIFNLNEFKTAGSYEVKFDGSNFASGMYFYKIEAGNFTDTKKMVLVK